MGIRRVRAAVACGLFATAGLLTAQGAATFIVPDGQIVVSGAETKAKIDDFAVIGGTGRYTGARGTLRATEGKRSTAFLFTFLG